MNSILLQVYTAFSNIVRASRQVLSRPLYILLVLLVAWFLVTFLNLARNFSLIGFVLGSTISVIQKMAFLLSMVTTFGANETELGFGLLIIVALLSGVNVAFVTYKVYRDQSLQVHSSAMAFVGTFAGIFAGGCASCALSLAAVFGVVGGLGFLPFQGLEITLAGIVILVFSLFWSSKSVVGVC